MRASIRQIAARSRCGSHSRPCARWPVSDDKISFEYKLKRFLEGCLMSPERAHVYWNGTFSDAEKQLADGGRTARAHWTGCLDELARVVAGER